MINSGRSRAKNSVLPWHFQGILGRFEPFLDLSSGVQTIGIESCQDMDFFVWDGSIEVIYTISALNFTAPLSVIRAVSADRGRLVGLPLRDIIGLFWLLTSCQAYVLFFLQSQAQVEVVLH